MITFCTIGGLMLYSKLFNNKVQILCMKTDNNKRIIEENPIFTKGYNQTFWLPMGWMQVFYGALFEVSYPIDYKREILRLRDGEEVP